jgi:SAM-dependent methyltransferase
MTERALSFGAVPEHYDRFRPGPDAAVLDWLLPPGASAAADVGAGTGALTRLLAARGLSDITAVEPDARMRRVLADRVGDGATILDGTGEALPLGDATQDAVLASSAWHWVDPERAVPEAARVLRPGGTLGVVWTSMDRDVGWIDDLQRTLRGHLAPSASRRGLGPRRLALPDAAAAAFAPVEGPHLVRFARRFTRAALLGLAGTYSAMIIHPDREALLDGIRAALARDPRFADPDGTDVPMVSRCFRAHRR